MLIIAKNGLVDVVDAETSAMPQASVIVSTDSPYTDISTFGINGHDVEAILLLCSDSPVDIVIRSTDMAGAGDDDTELVGPCA